MVTIPQFTSDFQLDRNRVRTVGVIHVQSSNHQKLLYLNPAMHLHIGHEEGAPGKPYRKMRRFTVDGITLEQALLFENDEWCDKFFSSFQKMNKEKPHRLLYLKWDVEKSCLSRNTVSWELIAAGQTGYKKGDARNSFNSNPDYPKVHKKPSHEPSFHGHKGNDPDLVMISPGEGPDVGKGGRDIGVGKGRCANVTNYMCCPDDPKEGPGTSREERKALWRMVGQVALARLGQPSRGFLWDKSRKLQHGQTAAEKRAETFPHGGHRSVEINTHGGGVPWLHVRVEAYPEYDTYTGAKN